MKKLSWAISFGVCALLAVMLAGWRATPTNGAQNPPATSSNPTVTLKPTATPKPTPEARYSDYALYCNDAQIDLSKEPLMMVRDPKTGADTLYFSNHLYGLFENLGVYYSDYRRYGFHIYTPEYLRQSDRWVALDEFRRQYQRWETHYEEADPLEYVWTRYQFEFDDDTRCLPNGYGFNTREEAFTIAAALNGSVFFPKASAWMPVDAILAWRGGAKPTLPPSPTPSPQPKTLYPDVNRAFLPADAQAGADISAKNNPYWFPVVPDRMICTFNDIPVGNIGSGPPILQLNQGEASPKAGCTRRLPPSYRWWTRLSLYGTT